jgi:hypothetical protein
MKKGKTHVLMKAGALLTMLLFCCGVSSAAVEQAVCHCGESSLVGSPPLVPIPNGDPLSEACLIGCMAAWGISAGIIAFVLMQVQAGFSIWSALVSAGVLISLIVGIIGCYNLCTGGGGGGGSSYAYSGLPYSLQLLLMSQVS